MYQVLLVDDEPLILSGIKFMVDWQALGCRIEATARNGGEALEVIERIKPDIVVCDINMPVMNGIELLQKASESEQAPVFIMLTNLEEFSLAREALRLSAVDYLVKSNLEPQTLEKALQRAIEEREKRGKLRRVDIAESYLHENRSSVIAQSVIKLLNTSAPSPSCEKSLLEQGVSGSYFVAQIVLDFSPLPAISELSTADIARLFEWEREVCEKLAGNLFKNCIIFDREQNCRSLTLFCYAITQGEVESAMPRFFTKLVSASENITQTRPGLLATNVFDNLSDFPACTAQLNTLRDIYYLTKTPQLYGWSAHEIEFDELDVQDIASRFISHLRSKNQSACADLFDKAYEMLCDTSHTQSAAVRFCTEIYGVICMVLTPALSSEVTSTYLTSQADMTKAIRAFQSKSEVILWLSELKRQTLSVLESLSVGKSDVVEKAKQYIQQNIETRIMLNDVANYVSISPSYLSALFKKEYNRNFVDYINETKIDRACEMIREGKYRIYEISYKLSFENAYYFTKVFKRYTGSTPTEYQRKLKNEDGND